MPPKAPGKVLIVEDEPLIAFLAQTALLDAGYDVVGTAMTAGQAVANAAETRPGIVLMDIRLRGRGDGVDAALEIRRRFGIPCIFTSATVDQRTFDRGRAAAPVAWLNKPYDLVQLVGVLDHFFCMPEHGLPDPSSEGAIVAHRIA